MSSVISNPLSVLSPITSLQTNGFSNLDLGQMTGAKSGYVAGIAPGTEAQLAASQNAYNQNLVNQNALAGQLQAQAQGAGPNPAQAMLNNATNQNIQQNAGFLASQKGINPAAAIRQAGQNQANMSAQAAGQGAAMQAQQQINAQNALSNLYGQVGSQALNQQNIAQQGYYAPQSINAGISTSNAKTNAGILGGLLGAGGTAMAMAHGGVVKENYADGGMIGSMDPSVSAQQFFNQQVNAPIENMKIPMGSPKQASQQGGRLMAGGPMDAINAGAVVPTMVVSSGGKVPGRAEVKGDSLKNDVVNAKLSPGEIVIPRSIAMSENPGDAAKKFVEQELSKHKNANSTHNYADGGEVETPYYLKPAVDENLYYLKPNEDVAKEAEIQTSPAQVMPQQPQQSQSIPTGALQKSGLENGSMAIKQPTTEDYLNPEYMNKFMMEGMNLQQKGLTNEAAAQGTLSREQADILNRQRQQIQKDHDVFEGNRQQLQSDINQTAEDYRNMKIDPKRYFSSMDTPKKFTTALGMIMGGLGAGLTGGQNQVMSYIDKQIDRDIESQKADMGKTQNLMSYNMAKLRNEQDAYAMTKAMHLQAFQNEIQASMAKNQNPIIQARLQQALAPIEIQKAQLMQNTALRKAMLSTQPGQAGGESDQSEKLMNYLRVTDPKRASELEERYIPGIGFGSIKVPEKVRGEVAGRHELDSGLSRLIKFSKEHQGSVDPKIMNEGKALASQVQDAYRRANGQGVFREAEADFVKGVIDDDPTKLFAKFRTIPKYKAAIEMNKNALNSTLSAYGFKPHNDLSKFEGAPVK